MKIYEYDAVIEKYPALNATYIDFPFDVEKEFGTKGQVKVKATFDKVDYRGSLARMKNPTHWLGITHITRFVSMSNMKHDAITSSGITIGERVPIPDELVPADARVEIEAKMAAGYYTEGTVTAPDDLADIKGRGLEE